MDKIFQEVLQQLRGIWRRRWYIVLVAWVVSVAGWAWINTLPDRYEASAQIHVNTDSILQPLLRNLTVTPNTEQRVRMMTQTLLTTSNLEQVARDVELDLRSGSDRDQDDVVEELRRNIRLVSRGGGDNLYTIRYTSADPEEAKDVVQAVVNLFMEGGIGVGRQDLLGSQRFIEAQVESYREKLAEHERKVEDFKREYAQLLPGQGGRDYYSRLEAIEGQLRQARLELREAENRKETFARQLEGEEPVLLGEQDQNTDFEDPELDHRLSNLRNNLDELRRRYTDQHPDVISVRRIINELEQEKEARAAARPAQSPASFQESLNPFQQHLTFSLSEAESRVASLRVRVEDFEERYQELKDQVDRIPRIESEYASLQREKNVVRNNYEQLLNTRERASMSGDVESQTEAVDFRVVEPPRQPSRPSDPNRPLLASAVLLLGVGAGTGLAFLLGQLRSTVTSRTALAELTGRPVLGMISYVDTRQTLRRGRLSMAGFSVVGAVLVLVYAAVLASYFLR
ncbi:XrtA system polysaccharide chain length determinant [Aquisalimonas sp.]|uniref:XrtA system polysaccharide chain length determinant n=1 Tax=unclassified Aquisalimonas TaxID=2644645 RepID=UPI0025C6411F|nr:XrtA system polysaccharide chain length determinant [Aquisalimonas sp.]